MILLEGLCPFQCIGSVVGRKEISAPSSMHCALLICTEELVSEVFKMPRFNNPCVSVSGEPVGIRIGVEGRCQAGGQGTRCHPVEKGALLVRLLPDVLSMLTEKVSI